MALFHIVQWAGSSVRNKRPDSLRYLFFSIQQRTLSEELAWSLAKIYHIHSVSEVLYRYPEVANGRFQLYLVPTSLMNSLTDFR